MPKTDAKLLCQAGGMTRGTQKPATDVCDPPPSSPARRAALPLLALCGAFLQGALYVVLKWLVTGRQDPGDYEFYGMRHTRWLMYASAVALQGRDSIEMWAGAYVVHQASACGQQSSAMRLAHAAEVAQALAAFSKV